jgi:hemolysin activation/secretion protein
MAVLMGLYTAMLPARLALGTIALLMLASTPVLAIDAAAPESASDTAAAPFDVWEFRVLGNTALEVAAIESAVYPFLGTGRHIEDIERARDALALLYRAKGLGAVYVEIPEQDVGEGVVRLQVTEGHLDRVRLSGARFVSNGWIREKLPSLANGQVLNTTRLQEELSTINRVSRDLTVVPVLKPGKTPGVVDLDLKVSDSLPLHASVEVNNRYTANTSQARLNASLSYDNLFQAHHSLSLQYQTAPAEPSQTRVIAATYSMPIAASRQLIFYAIDSNSDVAAIGALSVIGSGHILGARYVASLESPSDGSFHSVSLGADYKDFADRIQLPDATDRTPIRYLTWSGLYSAGWSSEKGQGSASLGMTLGIRELVNDADQFAFKRFRASPNFLYFRGSLLQEQAFLLGTRLVGRLSGQLTDSPLISNEQLSAGGADSVRGYLESEALGDRGAMASIELRSPALVPLLGSRWKKAYFSAFVDAGRVYTIDALPSQSDYQSLASWGLGLRLAGLGGLELNADWAMPRARAATTHVGDSRFHLGVSYAY